MMGMPQINWMQEHCTERSGTRNVLWALANRANKDTGLCWPGTKTIAKESGLSQRQVKRHLKTLEGRGLISIKKRTGTTSLYTFLMPEGGDISVTGGVTSVSLGGCHGRHHGGDIGDTLTQREPEGESEENPIPYGESKLEEEMGRVHEGISDHQIMQEKEQGKLATGSNGTKNSPIAKVKALWQEVVPSTYDSAKFFSGFNEMEQGQIKHFFHSVGDDALSLATIESCLKDWYGFSEWCKVNEGLEKGPMTPNVGFLLTHRNSAVNFHLDGGSVSPFKAPVAKIPPKPVKQPVPSPNAPQPKGEGHSEEELMAILGWDDE